MDQLGFQSMIDYRKAQGAKAQAYGGLFESMFLNSCKRAGLAITRLPNGCKTLSAHKIVRIKTPFDWIITYKGRCAYVDTKTSQGKVFAHSMIADHQVNELLHHELAGALAGYVVWLRENNHVVFIPSSLLTVAMKVKGSISPAHANVVLLGNSHRIDMIQLFEGRDQPVERE